MKPYRMQDEVINFTVSYPINSRGERQWISYRPGINVFPDEGGTEQAIIVQNQYIYGLAAIKNRKR
jgi:hypothetical protein